MESGTLQIDQLWNNQPPRRVGRRVVHLESVGSTNDEAWAYLEKPDGDGVVILAEHQAGGRGRQGRTWHAPRGAAVLTSLLLIEPADPDAAGELPPVCVPLIAGIAMNEAIGEATDVEAVIKWPNDLVVGGRKLGGALVEARHRPRDRAPAYVLGMGINCLQHRRHFPPDLVDTATSLDLESKQPIARLAVARALLRRLDAWFSRPYAWNAEDVRRRWLELARPLGRIIRIRSEGREFEGTVLDLDPTGALVLQLVGGGVRAFRPESATVLHAEDGSRWAD